MHAARQARSTSLDKVSNGRLLPKSVDLRSAGGRRFKHLLASYSAELGGNLSEADQALLRQGIALQIESERLQADITRGADVDRDMLVRVASESRRALSALKAKAAKNAPLSVPTPLEYAARKAAEKAASASAGEVA